MKQFLKRSFLMGLAAASIIASGCSPEREIKSLAIHPTGTPSIADAAAEATFRAQIGSIGETNQGLTVERIKTVALDGFPTPSPYDISILVLNHTTEPIRFSNIGFGIRVFEFDPSAHQWRSFSLPYFPEPRTTILPPKLENYDFQVLNGWDFSPDDLTGLSSNQIRIFVNGVGAVTGKKYGAFLDVNLESGSV